LNKLNQIYKACAAMTKLTNSSLYFHTNRH